MRKLTLNDRFLPHQYSRIENEAGIKIPDHIKEMEISAPSYEIKKSDGNSLQISLITSIFQFFD